MAPLSDTCLARMRLGKDPGLSPCPSQHPTAVLYPTLSVSSLHQRARMQLPTGGRILPETFPHWGFWQGWGLGGQRRGAELMEWLVSCAWAALEEQVAGPMPGQRGSVR